MFMYIVNKYKIKAFLLSVFICICVYTGIVFAATCKTVDAANLRSEPSTSSKILAVVYVNTQVELVSKGDTWSKVSYNGKSGYIRNDLLEFSNVQTSSSSTTQSSATLKNGDENDGVKELQQLLTNAKVYSGPVNGRFGPLTEKAVKDFQQKNGLTVDGVVGANTLSKLKTAAANQPSASSTPTAQIVSEKPVEVVSVAAKIDDNAILGVIIEEGAFKKGDSGDKIKDAQTLLNIHGYYIGTIDGSFGSQTEVAVKAFQKSNSLTADGILGQSTLKKLISSTVITASAAGYDPKSSPAPNKSNVELTPWSEAKQIFTIGVPALVYDCKTGISYYVKSFSNGNHADVEPVTKEDTAKLKQTYGGTWSWTPRPVWVTINGKTMAASINGMPHGGGVNSANGMDGQVCIHFKGSSTHNGNSSFGKSHQDAALEAYNMAQ